MYLSSLKKRCFLLITVSPTDTKKPQKSRLCCVPISWHKSTLCICGYSFDSFSIFRKIIGLISQRGAATGFSQAVLFWSRTFFSFLCEALRLSHFLQARLRAVNPCPWLWTSQVSCSRNRQALWLSSSLLMSSWRICHERAPHTVAEQCRILTSFPCPVSYVVVDFCIRKYKCELYRILWSSNQLFYHYNDMTDKTQAISNN